MTGSDRVNNEAVLRRHLTSPHERATTTTTKNAPLVVVIWAIGAIVIDKTLVSQPLSD